MSVAMGLRVMAELMEAEWAAKVGPKHAKQPNRAAHRHGTALDRSCSEAGARTLDGREVQLDTYTMFSADHLLGQVVIERMLAGLVTRRHRAAGEPVGAKVQQVARSTSKSAVSRRFVTKTPRRWSSSWTESWPTCESPCFW
jgi:hypothetical protein